MSDDKSALEKIATGVAATFFGSFLGAAIGKDLANIAVNLLSSAIEEIGISSVKRLRSSGNHDLEKLLCAAISLSAKQVLSIKNDHGGQVYWGDTIKTALSQLEEKLMGVLTRNDEEQTPLADRLLAAVITGDAAATEASIDSIIAPFLQASFKNSHKEWKDVCLQVAIRFFQSFSELYKEDEYRKGRLALEREIAWATHQELLKHQAAMTAATVAHTQRIDNIIKTLEIIESGQKELIWEPRFEQVLRALHDGIEQLRSEIRAEGERTRLVIHQGFNTMESQLSDISSGFLATVNRLGPDAWIFIESEKNRLNALFDSSEGLDESDVIRGLCSFDLRVRQRAAFYAGEYRVESAVPLLVDNLESKDEGLVLFSIQSLGFLKAQESISAILSVAINPVSTRVFHLAIETLTGFGSRIFTEESLPHWIAWFKNSKGSGLAGTMLRLAQQRGEVSLDEFTFDFIHVANSDEDSQKRECALYMLSNIPSSLRHWSPNRFLEDQDESFFVKYAALDALLNCGDFEKIAEFAISTLKLANSKEPGHFERSILPNVVAYCVVAGDHPSCQLVVSEFRKRFPNDDQLQYKVETCRKGFARPNKNAVRIGAGAEKATKLACHEELKGAIDGFLRADNVPSIDGDRRFCLAIVVTKESDFVTTDVLDYFAARQAFVPLDWRDAGPFSMRNSMIRFRQNRSFAIALGPQVTDDVEAFLRNFRNGGYISFGSVSREGHKLAAGCRIVVVIDAETLRTLTDRPEAWETIDNFVEI